MDNLFDRILSPIPYTQNPKPTCQSPDTIGRLPLRVHAKPQTLRPTPETLNQKTRNPKPHTVRQLLLRVHPRPDARELKT